MRRRFFVEKFEADSAVLEGATAHHVGRVLRAQLGQLYELSDGKRAWLGRIDAVGRDRVEFALVEELPAYTPPVEITLLLAVVKFDAFEWALEKATEMGVALIVPLAAARSEKALLAASEKRAERWRKILAESSQQSRRLSIPRLGDLRTPGDAFVTATPAMRLLLSERLNAPALRTILNGREMATAALAIGPEGGWTDEEIQCARSGKFVEASLGKLILRTETAVVAALACVNYAAA